MANRAGVVRLVRRGLCHKVCHKLERRNHFGRFHSGTCKPKTTYRCTLICRMRNGAANLTSSQVTGSGCIPSLVGWAVATFAPSKTRLSSAASLLVSELGSTSVPPRSIEKTSPLWCRFSMEHRTPFLDTHRPRKLPDHLHAISALSKMLGKTGSSGPLRPSVVTKASSPRSILMRYGTCSLSHRSRSGDGMTFGRRDIPVRPCYQKARNE